MLCGHSDVSCVSVNVDHQRLLIADNPGIVTRRHIEHGIRPEFGTLAVRHLEAHATRNDHGHVVNLTERIADDRSD